MAEQKPAKKAPAAKKTRVKKPTPQKLAKPENLDEFVPPVFVASDWWNPVPYKKPVGGVTDPGTTLGVKSDNPDNITDPGTTLDH